MKQSEARKLQLLKVLTKAMCEDAGIRVESRDRQWAFNSEENVIYVSENDLKQHGPEYCAGILAHEVGHVYLSRYPLFMQNGPESVYWGNLLNALEDPRVDLWMRERYPGVQRWQYLNDTQKDARMAEGFSSISLFQRFCLCAAMSLSGEENVASCCGPLVARVLKATWKNRQSHRRMVPAADFLWRDAPSDLPATYRLRVHERRVDGVAEGIDNYEMMVQLSALAAFEFVEEQIGSFVWELIEEDIKRITWFIRDANIIPEAEKMLESDSVEGIKHVVRSAICSTEGKVLPPIDSWPASLAEELYQRYLGYRKRDPFRPLKRVPKRASPIQENYDYYRQTVCRQITSLSASVSESLRHRTRMESRRGYPSGSRVDLRQLMAFQADPRRYDRLWQRNVTPERKSVAMLLLVDLSGSMYRDKICAAMSGTVLLAEVLAELGIPFAVNGFQDVVIPFFAFDDVFDEDARSRIAEMTLEVSSDRPGGNNCHGHNDDGPCLTESAEQLLQRPEHDRVLIVVSDGSPAGRRSDEGDLHNAVKYVTSKGIDLIGIGLGEGTEHVTQFYPHSIANVPTDKLAEKLGGLIGVSLQGA